MSVFNYSIANDFPTANVLLSQLMSTIGNRIDGAFQTAVIDSIDPDNVIITFASVLDADNITLLNNIIATHIPYNPVSSNTNNVNYISLADIPNNNLTIDELLVGVFTGTPSNNSILILPSPSVIVEFISSRFLNLDIYINNQDSINSYTIDHGSQTIIGDSIIRPNTTGNFKLKIINTELGSEEYILYRINNEINILKTVGTNVITTPITVMFVPNVFISTCKFLTNQLLSREITRLELFCFGANTGLTLTLQIKEGNSVNGIESLPIENIIGTPNTIARNSYSNPQKITFTPVSPITIVDDTVLIYLRTTSNIDLRILQLLVYSN